MDTICQINYRVFRQTDKLVLCRRLYIMQTNCPDKAHNKQRSSVSSIQCVSAAPDVEYLDDETTSFCGWASTDTDADTQTTALEQPPPAEPTMMATRSADATASRSAQPRQLCCPHCGQTYKRQTSLEYHIRFECVRDGRRGDGKRHLH